ncbi:MAG: hypothetical protein KC457_21830 [Myxococcales bacterium]|nr:hypothetical protein [Myxococcales bacterium]
MQKRMRRGPRLRAASRTALGAAVLCLTLIHAPACARGEVWDELRWPSDRPGAPTQPQLESGALRLTVEAMSWEPEAVVLELRLENLGEGILEVDGAAILLRWDGLEFPQRDEAAPSQLRLGPGEQAVVPLRYRLGRPLTAAGAKLVLRGLQRDGNDVIEIPELPLPPQPVAAE